MISRSFIESFDFVWFSYFKIKKRDINIEEESRKREREEENG